MDHQLDVIRELKPDDFDEVAGGIKTDGKDLRRIGVGFEVDDSERIVDCMPNGCLIEAVLERRSMKLHIVLYRNTNVRLPAKSEFWHLTPHKFLRKAGRQSTSCVRTGWTGGKRTPII